MFAFVCLFGIFGLFAIFAQLRFDKLVDRRAVFSNVSGLNNGDFVRIAGVEVGKVRDISVRRDSTVLVTFAVDPSVVLTRGSRATIRYDNLIRGRYLAIEEGAGSVEKLRPGDSIPLANTSPALDLDALIGGFRPLFRALDPDQVNALSGQLISAFQGQGATIGSVLDQASVLTNTLADRDQLIGQVIGNLDTILGSLNSEGDRFAKAVDSISTLVQGVAARRQDISNGVAYANSAARSLADLLEQARPPLKQVITQTDRTAGGVVADQDYLDYVLNGMPDAYRVLSRQGMYGDFFSFYLCDVVLKLNGKGGQPVYVKMVGQNTGRCAA